MKEADKKLTCQCRHCNETQEVHVNVDDLIDWQTNRKYIQDAMPYLSADQRELLISGTCGTCWDNMFGWDEEEDLE